MYKTIKFKGNSYTPLRNAYIDHISKEHYRTFVVLSNDYIEGDVTDHYESRGITIYNMRWDILDRQNDNDDESKACDWENPESVEPI